MKWRHVALAAALIALPAVANAQAVLKKAPVVLDPAKAYVVVELGQLDGAMLPASLVIARYDVQLQDIAEPTPRVSGAKGRYTPDNRLTLLGGAMANDGKKRLMVAEVPPGLWVIEGANDTAFSLGSSTVDLAPGSVTDLGVANVYSDFPEGEERQIATAGSMLKGALSGGLLGGVLPKPMPRAVDFRPRQHGDLQLPAPFAAKAAGVAWAGQVEFGNYLGGMVNRMGGIKSRGAPASPVAETPQTVEIAPAAAPVGTEALATN